MLKIVQLLKCLKGLITTTMNSEQLYYSSISPNGPYIVFIVEEETSRLTPVAHFFDEERAIEYLNLKKELKLN